MVEVDNDIKKLESDIERLEIELIETEEVVMNIGTILMRKVQLLIELKLKKDKK